ncbi:DUF2568 domain-containing protein [Streptomyces bobili]|uniref:DUF2568 domain-containing protein n=1 Tax=Streptomyces bobili TaxID=67280 RepID=UPI0037A59337
MRFALEPAALVCFGIWSWVTPSAPLRYVVAVPVDVAVLWGVFATPADASRSGGR